MFEKYLTPTGRLSIKQPQEIKDQWYIDKAIEVHGTQYDYSQFTYQGQNTKSIVLCPDHGSFLVRPQLHIAGSTCPKCQDIQRSNRAGYLQQFKEVHGSTYTYEQVDYVNQHTKVQITCKIHGQFKQTPSSHLQGTGCPKCQNHNQNILYLIRCKITGLTKIGITGNLNNRICSIGGTLELLSAFKVGNPRQLEKELHNFYQGLRVFNPTVKSGGTEFFNLNDTNILEIQEHITNVRSTIT